MRWAVAAAGLITHSISSATPPQKVILAAKKDCSCPCEVILRTFPTAQIQGLSSPTYPRPPPYPASSFPWANRINSRDSFRLSPSNLFIHNGQLHRYRFRRSHRHCRRPPHSSRSVLNPPDFPFFDPGCVDSSPALSASSVLTLRVSPVPALAADVLNQQAEAAAIADTFLTTSVFPAVAAAKRQVSVPACTFNGGNPNVAPTIAVRQVGGAGGNVNVAPTVAVVAQAASDVVASVRRSPFCSRTLFLRIFSRRHLSESDRLEELVETSTSLLPLP